MESVLKAKAFDELTARELHDLLRLRIDVFVVEQECAYPELDGRDVEAGTRHLWLMDGDAVGAVLRVLDDGEAWRIGRVATATGSRGSGLAGRLMREALAICGDRPVVLAAQTYLRDWYAGFGFRPDGEEFVEDGIPHLPMRRDVGAAA